MTCKHEPGNPKCNDYLHWLEEQKNARILANAKKLGIGETLPETPDSERFEIIRDEIVGPHLVLTVQYPNCKNCAYEGQKTMVFLRTTYSQALKWRRIDPHFRDQDDEHQSHRYAPSPDARFPANASGWDDAIAYAKSKPSPKKRG